MKKQASQTINNLETLLDVSLIRVQQRGQLGVIIK